MADRDANPQTRATGQRNKKTVAFSEPMDATGDEDITEQQSVPGAVPSELYGGHYGGPPVAVDD